jgi:pilus assembly protein TadC
VALAVRLYVRPSLARFFATWAVGVTAGVLVRALILGRQLNGNQAAFLATSLVFTLLFVVALRAVLSAAPQRVR